MNIIVRDNLGRDVTNDREWYIDTNGKIFYYTGDIDGPLYVVDNDYTFEVISDGCTSPVCQEYDIHKYPFFVNKETLENVSKVDANRIARAKENINKYIRL